MSTAKVISIMLGALALLIASLLFLIIEMADRTLTEYGERASTGWANYIGARLTDLEHTATNGQLTADDREFLEGVLQFGEVFRYKIFDASGRLTLISDMPVAEASDRELALHNPTAFALLKTGRPSTEVKDGTAKPDRPDVYVESYVPLMRGARLVAIVEVYIDQTAAAAALDGQYLGFGLRIIGLTLLAVSIPAVALVLALRQLRSRNAALVIEREVARDAERAKSEFLAKMSHEIRTPMNGVMGMAELLAASPLNERQRLFVSIIRKSADLLLGVINDILDFSKIDAGRMTLDAQPFVLARIADEPAQLVAHIAESHGLELVVRVQPDLPEQVVGDFGRLRQVVTNLLSNAVKFTEQGEVVADVSGKTRVEGGRTMLALRVEIRDTGVGIPRELQRMVFDQFTQVDGSTTRRHQGTGLGLSICQGLVKLMGGKIGVTSAPGEGSTFWFTVALPVPEPAGNSAGEPFEFAGARALVIDDNTASRSMLLELLTAWRIEPAEAASGPEALPRLLAAAAEGRAFDVVLLDHGLPGMSGAEVVRAVRAAPAIVDTPILLLSSIDERAASGRPDLGVAAQIVKPVSGTALRAALQGILGRQAPAATPPAAALGRAARPAAAAEGQIDVLLVEDNEVNRVLVEQTLIAAGFSHLATTDGAAAVEAFQRNRPRAIVMDISMPEMDGYAATRRIRTIEAERALPRTPIIGLTAHALQGDREKCLEAGMDEYLAKPFTTTRLVELVKVCVAGSPASWSIPSNRGPAPGAAPDIAAE